MITFSVIYPCKKGSYFNMEYYCNTHIAIAKKYFGDTCKGIVILNGKNGWGKEEPSFSCIAHLFFNSVEEFEKVMQPANKELTEDVKNFTNIEPIAQIDEVSMNYFIS